LLGPEVSDIVPRVFVTHRRLVMAIWVLMAALNLAVAVVITSWPERRADLDTIQRWGGNGCCRVTTSTPSIGTIRTRDDVRCARLVSPSVPLLSIPGWVDAVLGHFDRVLMLALFAATGILAFKAARVGSSHAVRGRADAAAEVVT
jgi:hypothetical protein